MRLGDLVGTGNWLPEKSTTGLEFGASPASRKCNGGWRRAGGWVQLCSRCWVIHAFVMELLLKTLDMKSEDLLGWWRHWCQCAWRKVGPDSMGRASHSTAFGTLLNLVACFLSFGWSRSILYNKTVIRSEALIWVLWAILANYWAWGVVGTPEFAASWSEVWDPWSAAEMRIVFWRTEPLMYGFCTNSRWLAPESNCSTPVGIEYNPGRIFDQRKQCFRACSQNSPVHMDIFIISEADDYDFFLFKKLCFKRRDGEVSIYKMKIKFRCVSKWILILATERHNMYF